ncbi:MAG TPA: GerMN domain-containing protein [Bacillales bacterium]
MNGKLKMSGAVLIIGIPLILSGCGLWGASDQANKSQNKNVNYVDPGDSLDMKKGDKKKDETSSAMKEQGAVETVSRKLFLVDKNGLVVPQTLEVPVTKSVAQQSLKYLVKGGPVQNILPNGFQAVLPAGTQILGADMDGNTLTVNFSKEFATYKPKNEEQILDAVTWTVTQFDNIDHVKIQIDGVSQTAMPVNGTPIDEAGASRGDGINEELGHVVDVTGTQAVTLYFPAQVGDRYYYVPVTTRTDMGKGKIVAAVNGLAAGPVPNSGLLAALGNDVKLVGQPVIKDGVVTLNFNKEIYSNAKKQTVSQKVVDSLVLSLTDQPDIKKVAIQVNGNTSIKTISGKTISEPVSRPQQVNTVGL